MGELRRMYGEVSDDARRGWDKATHGLPLADLLEAFGQRFDDGTMQPPPEVLKLAQEIAAERRSRRKR